MFCEDFEKNWNIVFTCVEQRRLTNSERSRKLCSARSGSKICCARNGYNIQISTSTWKPLAQNHHCPHQLGGSGPVFCLLLGVSSDYAQPITGQVTEVTCPVIGWAQPELTPSTRQKTGPVLSVPLANRVYVNTSVVAQRECQKLPHSTLPLLCACVNVTKKSVSFWLLGPVSI